jgi:hypothetical protein
LIAAATLPRRIRLLFFFLAALNCCCTCDNNTSQLISFSRLGCPHCCFGIMSSSAVEGVFTLCIHSVQKDFSPVHPQRSVAAHRRQEPAEVLSFSTTESTLAPKARDSRACVQGQRALC